MKQHYFIKFDSRINQVIGCPRATLILSAMEYWFTKKSEGFYKFMEPCSHHLYKKGDSWAEELGCERRSFARSFKKIGVKYNSRMAFEHAPDKFQGQMYASYYDRYTNRTFFIRNHDVANEFLKDFLPQKKSTPIKETSPCKLMVSVPDLPLSIGHNGLSYKELKNTSNDLSKDKSHASDEIVKKMIEFWTALIEGGKGQIELTNKRIAFLKKAFVDKFDSCLEKWKKYCEDIASSRFLMGEIKSSFRATLDWALKFDIIQKILEGNYGIGDRNKLLTPSACESFFKNSKIEMVSEEESIRTITDEPEPIRTFRLKWLNRFGAKNYLECLKECAIESVDDATLILRPTTRYKAKSIASYWIPSLFAGSPFTRVNIVQQEGGLIFDKWFVAEQRVEEAPRAELEPQKGNIDEFKVSDGLAVASVVQTLPETTSIVEESIEKSPEAVKAEDGKVVEEASTPPETWMLRQKLRESLPPNQFPSWLERIEVEGISQDDAIVVTLEDFLAVEWCRSRFSEQILTCAQQVWRSVSSLVMREKPKKISKLEVSAYFEGTPSGATVKEATVEWEERYLFEQAVQSLMDACSPAQPFCGHDVT